MTYDLVAISRFPYLAILPNAEKSEEPLELGCCFGADPFEEEVRFLMERKWAENASDVLWRRSNPGGSSSPMRTRQSAIAITGEIPSAAKPLIYGARNSF